MSSSNRYVVQMNYQSVVDQDSNVYCNYYNCEADSTEHAIYLALEEYPESEVHAVFAQVF